MLFAVLAGPGERAFELLLVIDVLVDAADEFAHVDRFATHPEILFEEVGVDDRAGNAHRNAAHRQIGLAAHHARRDRGTGEAEQFFAHVFRNGGIGGVLHVAPVNTKRRKSLLRMGRQHRREINRAGPLGAVESPHRLLGKRIHIHRLGAVAPAGRHGQRRGDAFTGELRGAGGRFVDAADGRVGDHALDRFAVRIFQCSDQPGRGFRHVHGLDFQRLPDPFPASVDGRANPDLRHLIDHLFHLTCLVAEKVYTLI
ncbi:hypothetical protein SDC9_111587 [bioreactor metagenome]|uniref:Uncharacterized protein n=1 Tax=bioreactor metagenome TaxID=1076179 RepID=A0A645BGW4_9ZZZZ